jgi:4,5-DOPA dioxygenase extradiol
MRQPVVFLGHGSPMNALGGPYAEGWRRLGEQLEKPKAVLVVSAHWYIEGIAVTAMPRPRTIHDFGGFPAPLYEVQYPAPGHPALAGRVAELLAPLPVSLDQEWGLDHGAWSVLMHVFPDADVPVLQLSIDERQPPRFHYDLGARLRPLRDEGVLVAGSGDVVHNLRAARLTAETQPYDWAARFETLTREALEAGRWGDLIDYPALGDDAHLSIPTPEHYLPLLYVLGAAEPGERVDLFNDAIELGSISMLSVVIGAA